MAKSKRSIIVIVLITTFVFLTGACSLIQTVATRNSPIDETWAAPQSLEQTVLPSIADVVAQAEPSVVIITTDTAAGSGWIIDPNGYIVTNNHVVEGASGITVTLSDGSNFSATAVNTDALTDLAVIRIDASDLPALAIGDSTQLEVGDWVVALGNALDLGISATVGIVSALDVTLSESTGQMLDGLIQTDAAINPGNSGGPLINTSGQVVGINSVKISEVNIEGMGYAISINEAKPIIQGLINKGYIVRPWLGIGAQTVNKMVASFYNLATESGVLVTEVTSDSPAEHAGLQAGDVIIAIDNQAIVSAGNLIQLINTYDIGQEVEITFWRNQTKMTTSLTLGKSPSP